MKAVNTLRIANTGVFMGPGPRELLCTIEQLSSLRQASIQTGISYTKALRLLKKMEEELGFAVVQSEKGGSGRGGTVLTPKGKQLLDVYTELEKQVQQLAQNLVDEKLAFLAEQPPLS
ncbi:MAG: winged helix-turn-helix domain-containing protein [Oscillospiraceae bacterium]